MSMFLCHACDNLRDSDDGCEEGPGAEEGEHPACWTDGLCWAENEDGCPSDPPILWTDLPLSQALGEPS